MKRETQDILSTDSEGVYNIFLNGYCSIPLKPEYFQAFFSQLLILVFTRCHQNSPRGGGTPLYKLYRYVPPQRVWFLSRFGLKTGIDFDHYGLKSGMVYKGTKGAYKRIYHYHLSFQLKMNSREREVSKIYHSS